MSIVRFIFLQILKKEYSDFAISPIFASQTIFDMMRQIHLICCFLTAIAPSYAQGWVTTQYTYDSTLNLVYGMSTDFSGQPEALEMDVYTPICTNAAAKRPLMVVIHGGAFLAGNKEDPSIVALCKNFARRGYVTATINYRLGFVADDAAWNCNYPNYNCVFASDTAEWIRAYYRGVQDAKGAVRYLVNRHVEFGIDPENIFLVGESAGAFVAMGAALLDHPSERMPQTFALPDAPLPSTNTTNCIYNQGKTFTGNGVARPNLGGIDGDIEPTTLSFTIKGVGNIFGGMLNNLLVQSNPDKPKPAIYSFHRPCDMVVPIDSARVNWGLSWCFTNGYNCNGLANTAKVYGSRIIRDWNTSGNLGYTMQTAFGSVDFPYSYLFGTGSCADQVNNPCHAYDNKTLREGEVAAFFAPLVGTPTLCDSVSSVSSPLGISTFNCRIFPNPATDFVTIEADMPIERVEIFDALGRLVGTYAGTGVRVQVDVQGLERGWYGVRVWGVGRGIGVLGWVIGG